MKKEIIAKRTISDNITKLNDNEIFVFGSNTLGLHGGGAALTAMNLFNAKIGDGEGITGQCYAIPTKTKSDTLKFGLITSPIDSIKKSVDKFIEHAKSNTMNTFLVTPIGTGIAGLKVEEIAPLFADAVNIDNIHLPSTFWSYITKIEE